MENPVLEQIKKFAQERLQAAYGYVGVAEAPNMAMLNSGGDGENLIIRIEARKE